MGHGLSPIAHINSLWPCGELKIEINVKAHITHCSLWAMAPFAGKCAMWSWPTLTVIRPIVYTAPLVVANLDCH